MEEFLETLERTAVAELLSAQAQTQFAQGDIARATLEPYTDALRQMSDWYNAEKRGRVAVVSELIAAQAYGVYFGIINAAKFYFLLKQLPASFWQRPIRALDFGCGSASGSLALASVAPQATILGTDSSAAMLSVAQKVMSSFTSEKQIPFSTNLSSRIPDEHFDLILMGNVLNEFPEGDAVLLAKQALAALNPGGMLVVLEPALKPITHKAMALRDELVSDTKVTVQFPCTHTLACPMRREEPDNWCHGELRWEAPRIVRMIDEVLGFNKHRIKYCGFIFGIGCEQPQGLRVVSHPENSKRGLEVVLCSDAGLEPVRFSKPLSKELKRLQHFDLLSGR